jgi:predicted RNA-binding Zn-ribbon protein involved in translation (DUF1610 family)
MIKIVCTSCQKPLSLDETKLPNKEVSFPCPVCKTKLTVDRRNLEMGKAAAPPQPVAPETAHEEAPDDAEGFGSKTLIVGADHPALRQAAKLIGCIPLHMPTAQQARELFVQEFPPVVMLNPPQITAPPLESMQPIISLTPADRRKAFFILFADNLRTLDGNAAFLYGVNLVVSFKDLGAFQEIYREAMAYHERLYASMHSVTKALAS